MDAKNAWRTKNPRSHWESRGLLDVLGLLATSSWRREGPPSQCPLTFESILYPIDSYGFIGSALFALVR